ncbi:flagellar biosynthesis repressor FlbT domain protein [Umbribacter vaginalis]|nr:flagellar biosynthesis repressor FlbT domain protein [Coriobacteriales bacterium DNF00809]
MFIIHQSAPRGKAGCKKRRSVHLACLNLPRENTRQVAYQATFPRRHVPKDELARKLKPVRELERAPEHVPAPLPHALLPRSLRSQSCYSGCV